MLNILIISFIICFGYIFYIKIKSDCTSISQSYYLYGKWFILWTILTGISILPAWLEVSPEKYQFISFLSTSSLIFVGAFPKYLTKDRIPHFLLASIAVILSILWTIFLSTGLILIPIGLISTAYILCRKRDDLLFWIEVAAFLSIYIEIFIKL